jgi:ribosomal protein S18 acetylase RimI-like enzyme
MPPLREREVIRRLLELDRPWAAYALADLRPGPFELTAWHGSLEPPALAMLYRGFDVPVLITMGAPPALALLLPEIEGEPELYLSVKRDVTPLLRLRYRIREHRPMMRMVLPDGRQLPRFDPRISWLGPEHLEELLALYADGESTGEAPAFFAPEMLRDGVYAGIREDGALVAAAGTHVLAPLLSVAAIGNVYTYRGRRGRGLGARVTGAVATRLLETGLRSVVLNVAEANLPARRCYEKLGFTLHCLYDEARATRAAL